MKYFSNVKRIVVLFSIICICFLFTSCSIDTVSTDKRPEQTTEEIKVTRYEQTIIATSISELTLQSDIVVLGKVVDTGIIVNMARNPENPSEPDPNYYGIGKIYDVEVEQYLKGDGEKTVHVVQDQGFMKVDSSKEVPTELMEKTISSHKHILIDTDNTYLLFLRLIPHDVKGYLYGSLFAPTSHPWLFDATDTKCIHPLSTLDEIYRYFHPQSLDAIFEKIGEPDSASEKLDTLPYPPPEKIYNCSNENEGIKPYP